MKSSLIGKAIKAINPSAKFTVHGDNTDTIDALINNVGISGPTGKMKKLRGHGLSHVLQHSFGQYLKKA